MSDNEKVRENRLRRMAARQGIRLEKSRRRDERAYDFGVYWLVDGPAPTPGGTNWRARENVAGGDYGLTLDEVEAALMDG